MRPGNRGGARATAGYYDGAHGANPGGGEISPSSVSSFETSESHCSPAWTPREGFTPAPLRRSSSRGERGALVLHGPSEPEGRRAAPRYQGEPRVCRSVEACLCRRERHRSFPQSKRYQEQSAQALDVQNRGLLEQDAPTNRRPADPRLALFAFKSSGPNTGSRLGVSRISSAGRAALTGVPSPWSE